MKTIALEDETYEKLLKLKSKVSELRNMSITFNELVEEIMRKPMGILLFDNTLREALVSLVKELSSDRTVLGIIVFGSVAKGNFHIGSDVDIFVITHDGLAKTFDFVESAIQKVELQFTQQLIANKLPATFSPLIVDQKGTTSLRPIFFDVADSGIIVYDRYRIASDFIEKYLSIPHKREFTKDGEVLAW